MNRPLQIALLLAALAWCVPAHAATVTERVAQHSSTACSTTFASSAFTPAQNELIVVVVHASDTQVTNFTLQGSRGLQYVKAVTSDTGAGMSYIFVSVALAQAISQTVTLGNCAGDATTGQSIVVYGISGVTRIGLLAGFHTAKQESQASGTPAITFDQAINTNNPTIVSVSVEATVASITPPTSWSETEDSGYTTPATDTEAASRNSGSTDTTVTWGASIASPFGAIGIELDTTLCDGPCEIQHQANRTTAGGSTIAVTVTATTSGNLLVVTTQTGPEISCSITGVADSSGSQTWTQATSAKVNNGNKQTDAWYFINTAAGVTTVTVTNNCAGGANTQQVHFWEVKPLNGWAFDTAAGTTGTGSGGLCAGAAVTTSSATGFIASYLSMATTVTVAPAAGNEFNAGGDILSTAGLDNGSSSLISTSAATHTPSYSASNDACTRSSAAFKDSGGGGGTATPPQQMLMGVGD